MKINLRLDDRFKNGRHFENSQNIAMRKNKD